MTNLLAQAMSLAGLGPSARKVKKPEKKRGMTSDIISSVKRATRGSVFMEPAF